MKDNKSEQLEAATEQLMASLNTRQSRRSVFKGVATATGGVALLGLGAIGARALPSNATSAAAKSSQSNEEQITQILSIARTAEQLAVTFYTQGIANASKLGIEGENLEYLKASLVEEQIHQQFFTANGGKSIADTFSFPQGEKTFSDLQTFIETQQQLEGVFDSAFLAAIKEFAQLGRPDLAQIAGQIACVESEHRALGRVIGKLTPVSNWAFAPVLIGSVADAPAVVTKAGFLSPKAGNSYTYKEVSTEYKGLEYREPFAEKTKMAGKG